jgi:hypothetical protein
MEEATRIEHVTIYARGARVRRVTRISDPPSKIRIVGLPLSVIDDTVRVEVEGPAIATTVRAGVDVPAAPSAPEDSAELRGAKRRVVVADAEISRIEAAIARLDASSSIAEDPTDDPPAAWAAIVTARRSLVTVRTERAFALHAQLAAARREREAAELVLTAIADREARAGTAKAPKQHEVRKYIDVELAGRGPIVLHVEYLVDAARWAPSYVARIEERGGRGGVEEVPGGAESARATRMIEERGGRGGVDEVPGGAESARATRMIDGEQVALELRAVVAQDTGEDWTAVPVSLSTAEPTRFAPLPELAAQRIGRKQQDPARAGFRAPPVGADALYADYERDVKPLRKRDELVPRKTPPLEAKPFAFKQEVWDEDSSAAKEAFVTPPSGMPMPSAPPPQAFVADRRLVRARTAVERPRNEPAMGAKLFAGLADEDDQTRRPEPAPPTSTPLLDYGNLVMAPPSSPARGRLIPAPSDPSAGQPIVEAGRRKVSALALPPGCSEDWSHTYDYAFATDGAVDVRSDGAWHSIAVTGRAATAKLHHVAVPREQADAFRLATFANPLAGPLLPGPIDVYDRGRFLVTSRVVYTPPGAPVDVGLGVDPAVKIARNTEFREEASGMLRGALKLLHAVTIDIDNVSGRAIELEVRERLPVTREGDDDIDVMLGRVDPAWERWTPDARSPGSASGTERLRGGYRWRVAVPAGQKRTLRAAYEVKIPAKSELVGGNRREP